MWKKSESEIPEATPATRPSPVRSTPSANKSLLGSSLKINGDLTGTEDVIIQGHVEGKVALKKNSVTVGKNGRVKADVYAESIYVEGEVLGNLYGTEKVVIRETGNVRGNISGPRVNLEEGARFKGSIDMEGGQEQASSSSARSKGQNDKQSEFTTAKSNSKAQSSREEEKPSLGFKVGSSSSKP